MKSISVQVKHKLKFIAMMVCALLVFVQVGYSQSNQQLGPGVFEGEPYLAINPTNPQNIVVAWMHLTPTFRSIRVRSTFDGGSSWNAAFDLPKVYVNTADPTMAFDNAGTLYLAYIDHNDVDNNGSLPDSGAVYCLSSTDGGLSWGNRSEVINYHAEANHPIDRPWLVCDRSNGPHDGNLYVTTKVVKPATPTAQRPYFVKSTDGGQQWSQWQYLDTTNWLSGTSSALVAPAVAADGDFYGMYPSYVPSQSPLPRYLYVKSADGGASFAYDNALVSIPASLNDSSKQGWQLIADPANADHLAFLYLNGPHGDVDIFMTETVDGGSSWSAAFRVNDDPIGNGKLQDLVWGSFDTDSDLVICWRDRRNASGSGYAQAYEIFGRVRWADSTSFSPGFAISDTMAQYGNVLSQAGNDFLCQQVHDDTLYVAWGDTRLGPLNIWFDKVALRTNQVTSTINLAHDNFFQVEIYPNPSAGAMRIVSSSSVQSSEAFDLSGKRLRTFHDDIISISDFPQGTYLLKVYAVDGSIAMKRIVKR